MASFSIKVRTNKVIRTHRLHAKDAEGAKRLGARYGHVMKVKPVMSLDFLPGMTLSERTKWFYRMSGMVSARVPTTEALKVMRNAFGGQIRKASDLMLTRMSAGFSIVEAFEQDPRNFPPTIVALVRAGMSSGNSARALRDVADYERNLAKIKRGSMGKIYQALGAFAMAAGIMWYSSKYISPQILDNVLFKQKGNDAGFEWTRTLGDDTLYLMYFLMALFTALFLLGTVGRKVIPDLADAVILRIPHYRDLVLARTFQTALYRFGLLVRQGVPLTEALKLCIEDTPPGAIRTDMGRALKALQKGRSWPDAMHTLQATDKAALATSADASDVAMTLEQLAEQYSEIYEQKLGFIGPALQTTAAVFLTASGAILFMQTMLPIMKLLTKLSH